MIKITVTVRAGADELLKQENENLS